MKKTSIKNENCDAFSLTHEQAKARYNLGSYTLEKIAKNANAVIRIGKRKMYVIDKIDLYLLQILE